ERDLLVERTQSGLARARAEGKRIGRPPSLSARARAAVREGLAAGESVAALARRHGTSRQTVMRIRDAAGAEGAKTGGAGTTAEEGEGRRPLP
ncbi:putative DNA-invertase from lambdoid prophage Rac, partial [Hasllibacter halocynthiae]